MKTHEKTASLSMQLVAESGYEAAANYQISPAQWGDVLKVCEGDLSFDTLRERDQLCKEVEKLAACSRELLMYIEDLERCGRAPHRDHRKPVTNYIREFDARQKTLPEGS